MRSSQDAFIFIHWVDPRIATLILPQHGGEFIFDHAQRTLVLGESLSKIFSM